MTQRSVCADLHRQEWIETAPGLRVKTIARGKRQLRLIEILPGVEHDWCETGHTGYVLEGTLELELVSETLTLSAGHGFFLEAGGAERHKPRAIGSRVQLLVVEDV